IGAAGRITVNSDRAFEFIDAATDVEDSHGMDDCSAAVVCFILDSAGSAGALSNRDRQGADRRDGCGVSFLVSVHSLTVAVRTRAWPVWQSRFTAANGRMYLLRVVVAVDKEPPVIVTVYRTSKIEKYWRPE